MIHVQNYAPNTGFLVLLIGLWLTALVVYATLLNPEGRLTRYVIVAASAWPRQLCWWAGCTRS